MQTKTWLGLAVVTAVVVAGAAYTVVQRDAATSEQTVEGALFPDLIDRVNDVRTVTVTKGDQTWTIRLGDAGWTMDEKDGYRASADRVKKTVVAMADLKILEPKTSNPDLYRKIGVDDVDKPWSEAVLVALQDDGGSDLAALLIGKTRSHESGAKPAEVYVRKPGEAASWLVEARLDVKPEAMAWLDPETLKVDKGRVRRVATIHPDGETVVIDRANETVDFFTLQSIPEGQKLRSTQRLGSMAAGLEFLGHKDVAPADGHDFDGKAAVTELTTGDGLRVTVEVLPEPVDEDHHWARFRAEFDDALIAQPAADDEKAEGDAAHDADAVRQEADAINARVAGWAYLLPDYRAEHFLRRMADLTEPAEPEEDAPKDDS